MGFSASTARGKKSCLYRPDEWRGNEYRVFLVVRVLHHAA